jgi:hypothetical protein
MPSKRGITLLDISKAYEQIPLEGNSDNQTRNKENPSMSYRTYSGSIDLDKNDNNEEY